MKIGTHIVGIRKFEIGMRFSCTKCGMIIFRNSRGEYWISLMNGNVYKTNSGTRKFAEDMTCEEFIIHEILV